MFEIKVNVEVTAPDLSQAIMQLADALRKDCKAEATPAAQPAAVEVPEVAPVTPQPATPAAPAASAQIPVQPAAPAQIIPIQPAAPAAPAQIIPIQPAAPAAPAAPEPAAEPAPAVIDLEMIGRAGAALVDQGKMPEVLKLLSGKYGVQAVTQLTPDQYPAFAADLRALGANI